MNPHRLSLATAGIVLLFVMTIPVTGAPALSQGARALYDLDASFSFVRGPNCTPTPHTICPMFATMVLDVDLNGTVGWLVTTANSTSVDLNVTSDLSLSLLNTTRLPTRTFTESVNLTNRLVSFPPPQLILDDALSTMMSQVQTTLPGCDPSTVLSAIAALPNPAHHLYTMWWVNGPLSQGERVPILALPPLPVLRQETVDLGSLGTRTAWVVGLESTSTIVPLISTMSGPTGGVNATAQLFFYYDTKSDLLLKSTASLQLDYSVDPSTSPVRTSIGASFTLTLASTSLNLEQPIPPSSTSSSGSGNGPGQGPGSGNNGGSGSNGQSTSSDGQSSGPTGSQPNINPGGSIIQSSNLKSPGSWPWVYIVSGLVVAVIASFGAWTVRRRRGAKPSPSTQAPYA